MLDCVETRFLQAPLFEDVAEGPADGRAAWLRTADGLRIRAAHWGAGVGRNGTVLIFCGRTEFVEKYGRTAAAFAARGYASVSVDWRGQGIAERLRPNPALGHVEDFGDYQLDVAAVMDWAARESLPRPFFLLGHSMGGCIGLRALISGLDVAACAFTAPMWGIQLSSVLRPVAWGLSGLSRPLRLGHLIAPGQSIESYIERVTFEANTLTSDRESFDHLRRQLAAHPDLGLGGPSLTWLNESLREMRALSEEPAPDVPAIAFLGLDESIIDPVRVRQRMDAWPGAELVTYEGARHELLMERPEIRDDIMARIDRHFAAVSATLAG